MSDAIATRQPSTPAQKYGALIENIANKELTRLFTGPDGAAAAAGVALAFRSAVAQSEQPDALLNCSPTSIAMCVANSARYRILPGGSNPGVYLVPKAGQLGWWLTHRGMCALVERTGKHLDVKPVYAFDTFEIEYGLNPRLVHVPKKGAKTWENLAGVYVIVRDIQTNRAIDMLYMDREEIQERRNKAGTQKVWSVWPIPQAMKTAIKYAIARGMVVLDEETRGVLSADAEASDVIDTTATVVPQTAAQRLDAALGITQGPDPVDYGDEAARLNDRERVAVNATSEPVTQGQEQATPYAAFVATLAAKNIDAEALGAWWAETNPADGHPRTWVRGLAEFAADVCADGSPILASFRAAGGGK